jgi:hypothetical protein
MQPGLSFAARQDAQEQRGLHVLSSYPRGSVVKVLVCHMNVMRSIPLGPGFFFMVSANAFLSPSRDRERGRKGLYLLKTNIFRL